MNLCMEEYSASVWLWAPAVSTMTWVQAILMKHWTLLWSYLLSHWIQVNKFGLLRGMSIKHGDVQVQSFTEMYWSDAHGKILVPLKPF